MEKMRATVVVSKCLGFAACRYNGQVIPDEFVRRMEKHVDFIPVCPEMEIGLGVPRSPIRIVLEGERKILFQPSTGRDVTREMGDFSDGFLSSLGAVDGFILKNGSPSCGPRNVKAYIGKDKVTRTVRESGFFGGSVLAAFPDLPAEDEGRLRNFTLREHFLVRLFTLRRFRDVERAGTIGALVEFHTGHKLLLLACSQAGMREMGRIIARHDRTNAPALIAEYRGRLEKALAKPFTPGSIINVLLHAFGGFSEDLSSGEKKFFLDSIEEYRDERIPLSTLVYLLRSWSHRFGNRYLLDQVFIDPYPRDLVEIADSGKGRDL